jgi:hypothetical protein
MKGKPYLYAGAVTLTLAAALGLSVTVTQADPPSRPKVPALQYDPSFPKLPLPVAGQFGTPVAISTATGKPKPWVTGEVAGTCVDSQDHVFTVNRGNLISPETVTAVPSPTVIEFDSAGNVVNAWNVKAKDSTGTLVPVNQAQIHGCFVDYQDNIWIGGNGEGVEVKYSHDGSTWLNQIGVYGPGGTFCDNPPANTCGNSGGNPLANQSHTLLNEPANVWVDPDPDPVTHQRGSVYVADGYGNHRVVVFQDNHNGTETWLRQWPAVDNPVATTVNNPLTDFPGLFAAGDGGHPHCVVGGNDGNIYACDRGDDRIQVFDKALTHLLRIIPVVPGTGVTLGNNGAPCTAGTAPPCAPGLGTAGSAWDLRFTNDAAQTYFFEIDGGNEIMHTMERASGAIVANLGEPGHEGGTQFTYLHSNTVDSKGNVYTGETINGRRIQKFLHVECNNGNGQGNGQGNCS